MPKIAGYEFDYPVFLLAKRRPGPVAEYDFPGMPVTVGGIMASVAPVFTDHAAAEQLRSEQLPDCILMPAANEMELLLGLYNLRTLYNFTRVAFDPLRPGLVLPFVVSIDDVMRKHFLGIPL